MARIRLSRSAVALGGALTALALSAAPAAAEHSVTNLLSTGPIGGNGASSASFVGASADGTRVFFTTNEPLVAADTDTFRTDVYERTGGQTTLVSDRVQAGADGPGTVLFGGASADGTRVFFTTDEPLVAADSDANRTDVYERAGGQTTLVSDRVQDTSDGAFDAEFGGASADGTRVFFVTNERLLAADADTDRFDVYEHTGGQTTLVSDRVQDTSDASFDASFRGASADGTHVFFETNEPLVTADSDADRTDVYERAGGQTTLVSDRVQDTSDGASDASFGGVSADGTRVFFVTTEALVRADGDTNREDVYERAGGVTRLVSNRVEGTDSAFDAFFGGASADGTHVFFTTDERLVAADTDVNRTDVYERAGGQTTLVSDGVQDPSDGPFDAFFGGASTDGTRVFFMTSEPLAAADGDTASFDVYERSGGQTTLVSDRVQAGDDGAFTASFRGASADGTRVFFTTFEPLVTADTDANRTDVYERAGGQTTLVSDRVQDTSDGAFDASFRGASADGTRVFFETLEPLLSTDGDTARDVYAARIPEPPDTTIAAGPSGPTNDATPSFEFTASEPGSSFECRIDAGQFAPCSSPFTSGALSDGPHTFEVRAIDPEGDTDATPATRGFTVDTQPPETAITSGPAGPTTDSAPTFTFAASESGSSFECRLDGAPFAPCSSPFTSGALSLGAHSFEVRATDALGTTDPTPASAAFTVVAPPGPLPDTTAPTLTGASLSNKRFATRRRGRSRTPVGTAFRFLLSEPATVRITIERALPGRRVGSRCAAPNRANRRRPACKRFAALGGLTRFQPAGGRRSIAFTGRLGRRTLAPGSYRATIIATDVAGNASQPVRLTFVVAAR